MGRGNADQVARHWSPRSSVAPDQKLPTPNSVPSQTGRRPVRTLARFGHCSRDSRVPAVGSQPQCSMHHQESSCQDVLTLGSQVSYTFVPPNHHLTYRPPSMPSRTGAFGSVRFRFGVGPTYQRLWCSGPHAVLQNVMYSWVE